MSISIRRLTVLMAGLLGLLSLAGCERKKVIPQSVSVEPSTPDSVAETIETPEDAGPKPGIEKNPEPQMESGPEPELEMAPEAELVIAEIEEPGADHRVWLPTTAGGLVMDVDIRIGDRSLREAYDESLQVILDETSSGESKLPSWRGFLDAIDSDPEQFGPSGMTSDSDLDNLLRLYDSNRNGIADREEAAKYLYRVAGTSAAFRVRGTAAFRHTNRENSRLWMAIDSNGDGQLSDTEREQAGEAIVARFDKNGDDRIDANEISDSTSTMSVSPWDRRKSHRRGDVAMDLDGYVDWSSVAFVLDRNVTTELFGISRNLHRDWDDNSSGSIDASESARLSEAKADLRIVIDFPEASNSNEQQTIAPVLRLVTCDPGIEPFVASTSDASTLAVVSPAFQLIVEAVKPVTPRYPAVWKNQVRGRAAEVPDAMFTWFDSDHDRSLSEREVSEVFSKVASIERPDEIPDTYLVQFGRGDPNQDDALFALQRLREIPPQNDDSDRRDGLPRWAAGMDANRDGEVSQTEFLGTAKQFERLDRNSDFFIDSWEASSSWEANSEM